ncbi:Biopolymer transport protein ExbD [Zhongshania aliphaticivorans]|uniref:Biopolymer transport protein ExbD n=1 Tax=Zhongshania aliphaticivorans TaxID=1470434 RepID=A0A5S9QG31_9GAMM|nr:biopolymer transporter ExbD [Zhongshania aliphaticivorans]CAA0088408.1 Biopolymer transport protein ExbD [Zhongshania aliphaticivorans]CAA0116477.1 Biopolymer transport protein ExbD [Zhongshania aliphaticivorans]CAA0120499.1 Biopolymer transport protein ExbD [Zhongshania aliphaticivorans]
MKFKRQRVDDGGVNLTPLIDVVFLLLIFFMVSTTFTKESRLNLELPSAKGVAAVDEGKVLEVVINAGGQYRVNETALSDNTVEALMAAMGGAAKDNKAMPVIITADANSPHQSVITAMDAAGRLGFAKLSLTTQDPDLVSGDQ